MKSHRQIGQQFHEAQMTSGRGEIVFKKLRDSEVHVMARCDFTYITQSLSNSL